MASKEVLQKMKDLAEQAKQTADPGLYVNLLSLWSDVMQLVQEKNDLEAELSKVKQAADLTARIKYEPPFYWLIDGTRRDGPFCQVCWDRDTKRIRLQEYASRDGRWHCHVCNTTVNTRGR